MDHDAEIAHITSLDAAPQSQAGIDSEISALQAVTSEETAPTSKEKAPSPVGSDLENYAAGTGMGLHKLASGGKQLLDIPAVWLEKKFPGLAQWAEAQGVPSAEQSAAQTNQNIAEARKRDAPLSDTKAGMAGDVTGQLAGTMVPLGAIARGSTLARALYNPKTYAAAAASGALQGALQPTAGNESKVINAGIGAVVGAGTNAAINAVGRVAQPVKNVLSAAHDKAVDVLESAGIKLDAAQKSGNTFLARVRSALGDLPFTAGPQKELAAEQQRGFNRAVLKTVGEDADAATPEVMSRAAKRINGVFKDVLDRNNVEITDTVLNRIGAVQAKAAEEKRGEVVSIANRLINAVDANGNVPGQIAYNIRKDLARLSSSSDSVLAYHAKQLENTVMDAIHGSLNTADRKAFAEARGQFSNLRRLEPTIDRMGGGDISAAKLANVMAQKRNRSASLYGYGPQELVDLSQSGNMLLGDKLAQSGTVPRSIMQLGLAAAVGGADAAYSGGDIKRALATAGTVYALPKVAQMALNSPAVANYLTHGIQGGRGATTIRELLLAPQNNDLIGGTLRRTPSIMFNNQ